MLREELDTSECTLPKNRQDNQELVVTAVTEVSVGVARVAMVVTAAAAMVAMVASGVVVLVHTW